VPTSAARTWCRCRSGSPGLRAVRATSGTASPTANWLPSSPRAFPTDDIPRYGRCLVQSPRRRPSSPASFAAQRTQTAPRTSTLGWSSSAGTARRHEWRRRSPAGPLGPWSGDLRWFALTSTAPCRGWLDARPRCGTRRRGRDDRLRPRRGQTMSVGGRRHVRLRSAGCG